MGCTAVSGWLCKISKSLGNLCIKLSLPGVWVMKKLCCLFSYFHTSAQLVQISTHLKRPRPKTAKARVFCLLHEEVCTVQYFTFHFPLLETWLGENTFFRIYLGLWVLGCLRDLRFQRFLSVYKSHESCLANTLPFQLPKIRASPLQKVIRIQVLT